MQPAEHVLGQLLDRALADAFEHDVAQIVERHGGKARGGVGQHQRQRDVHRLPAHIGDGHRIDRTAQRVGHRKDGDLGQQDQQHRARHAPFQPGAARPEIRQEPAYRAPVRMASQIAGEGVVGGHRGCKWGLVPERAMGNAPERAMGNRPLSGTQPIRSDRSGRWPGAPSSCRWACRTGPDAKGSRSPRA